MRKFALDYTGDPYPGETDQKAVDAPPERDWNPTEEYVWFYGNGQFHISEDHDHEELAGHAGVRPDHTGPMAVGHVHVDMQKATFDVQSNIGAQAIARVLKDYCKTVGWIWGGMTDETGDPIGAGSEFAPVKSFYYSLVQPENKTKISILAANLKDDSYSTILVAGTIASVYGPVTEGLEEWADDQGYKLVEAGNDNVMKRIEDMEENNTYTPEWNDEEDHFMFQNPPDERQPGGVFKCQGCGRIFHNWNVYMQHRNDEEPAGDYKTDPTKDTKWLDMDAPLPPHFHDQPSFTEAKVFQSAPGSLEGKDSLPGEPPVWVASPGRGFDETYYGWRRPVVWHPETNQLGIGNKGDYHHDVTNGMGLNGAPGRQHGWVSVEPHPSTDGNLDRPRGFHMRPYDMREFPPEQVAALQRRLVPHEPEAAQYMDDPHGDGEGGWDDDEWVTGSVRAGAPAAPEGKDMIAAPIPFIYDIDEDRIIVGNPGTRHSDIPGKFTPGGMVEGTYEPGGKVEIRSMTNMPYTVRHMLELWYYQHPHMEIKNVHLVDDADKRTKLASASWHKDLASLGLDPVRLDEIREEGRAQALADTPMTPLEQAGSPGFGCHYIAPEAAAAIGGHHESGIVLEANGAYVDHHWVTKDNTIVDPTYQKVIHADHPERSSYVPYSELGESADPEENPQGFVEWRRHRAAYRRHGGQDIGGYIMSLVGADPTAWRASRALRQAGGKVYVVGGAVRDALKGKEPHDLDLMVTGLPAEDVRRTLAHLDGRVDLTGKDFGVFRYKQGGGEVEIALPRRERSTGPGHKDQLTEADHTMTPEEDLFRRDFTVNAMAVDLDNGHLIDPFGGANDVKDARLRTLNTKSLSDDPLRTVRALVATSKHGFYPDDDTKAQMSDNAEGLLHLPGDRIREELDKLFAGDSPADAIRLAHETGLLKHLLPKVDRAMGWSQDNPHHELELGDHLVNVMERVKDRKPGDIDLILAGLLHDTGKHDARWDECKNCTRSSQHEPVVIPSAGMPCPNCGEKGSGHYYKHIDKDGNEWGANHEDVGATEAEEWMRNLHYSEKRIERVKHLVQHHMFPAFDNERGARRFMNKVGDEHADDLLALRWADQGGKSEYPTDPSLTTDGQQELVEKAREEKAPTQRSQLAVNGSDLMAAGIQQGPLIGQILNYLVEATIENPELNTKEALIGLAHAFTNRPPSGIISSHAQRSSTHQGVQSGGASSRRGWEVRGGPRSAGSNGLPRRSMGQAPGGDGQAEVEPWFPNINHAIGFNKRAIERMGQDNHVLLRPEALEGALGRAQNHWYYGGSLHQAAAALAHGVGQAQSFEDGNKRTAYWLTHAFLRQNNLGHIAPHDDTELSDHLIGYAKGKDGSPPTHTLEDTAAMFEARDANR